MKKKQKKKVFFSVSFTLKLHGLTVLITSTVVDEKEKKSLQQGFETGTIQINRRKTIYK